MPKYQNPNFDRKAYWESRKLPSRIRNIQKRILTRGHAHSSPEAPLPITKKALLASTKARRKLLGEVYYVQWIQL